ncbi:DUF2690 domain-containing protein [Micromonospora chaiyaphumensis]|uniref:DUF2690 domain-containing protein n=1 Tax=Micromonospora chaiyaphumensis TaxID=307119 RepID=A0A1C4XT51_9ACTN|nr:DUF2690 domain-containing protein [Micromonospora chaiyaphumensis]SCF11624.1 Protein of unknown function [Micromonospora chaiyaphumensis]
MFLAKHSARVRQMAVASMFVMTAVLAAPGAASASTTTDPDLCRNGGGSGYLSCNGKDPNALGCTGVTKADGQAKNGVYIELRYSSTCQAYWTRYTNSGGSTGEAQIKGTSVTYKKTLAAYAGETGWTPMAAANQSPKACLHFYYAATSQWMDYCVG